MTSIPDLSRCTYVLDAPDVLAVGWLGTDATYPMGAVDEAAFEKLMELLVAPWNPFVMMGFHQCELCRFSGGPGNVTYCGRRGAGHELTVGIGNRNLFLPAGKILYVAPSSIVHYIDAHGYAPPQEFLDAVVASPPMGSMEYKKALLRVSPEFVSKFIKRG